MSETISIIADLALTLSLIVAVVFGIAQVRTAARDRRERLTLETLRLFQTRETVETMLFISSHDLPATQKEFRQLPADEQAMIFQFGQQMESLGMLLAEKYINIDLVDKTLGSFVTSSWEKYKVFFLDVRAKQPDPYLGEYFQWMAEQLDTRMKTVHEALL
jgi:hypothetical protein